MSKLPNRIARVCLFLFLTAVVAALVMIARQTYFSPTLINKSTVGANELSDQDIVAVDRLVRREIRNREWTRRWLKLKGEAELPPEYPAMVGGVGKWANGQNPNQIVVLLGPPPGDRIQLRGELLYFEKFPEGWKLIPRPRNKLKGGTHAEKPETKTEADNHPEISL